MVHGRAVSFVCAFEHYQIVMALRSFCSHGGAKPVGEDSTGGRLTAIGCF